jgi:hypothetical protein
MQKRVLAALLFLSVAAGFALADDRSDAEHKLEQAISSQNAEQVKSALAAAMRPGDARAAKLFLLDALRLRGIGVHEELLDAIKGITDEAGLKELAEAAKKSPQVDLRYLLIEGLALQGSDTAARAVIDGLEDRDDTVSTIAARSVRNLKSPEAVERLMARLEKAEGKSQETSLAREINGALVAITGQELSFAAEWKSWWQSHKTGWKAPEAAEKAKADEGGGTTSMDRLRKNRPEDAHTIERMSDDDVIVVKGHSDQIEDVLKALKIPHKAIEADKLTETKLDPKSILVLNCNSRLNPYSDFEFTKIREFVDKGGYLFTSDWQLEFLMGKVFPGTISLDKKIGKDALVVPIKPSIAGSRHPFLRDVFPMSTSWDKDSFVWHMDSWSELIKVQSPGVTVLIESPDLQSKFQNGAVAVTFRWHNGAVVTGQESSRRQATGGGKGHEAAPQGGCVLHVLGHFKHQRDKDSGDHFALQQLLLNFFLEKKHGSAPAAGGN